MVMSALHPPILCSNPAIVDVGFVLVMLSHSDLLSVQISTLQYWGWEWSQEDAVLIASSSSSNDEVCGRPLVLMVSMTVGFSGGPVVATIPLPPLEVPSSADPSVYIVTSALCSPMVDSVRVLRSSAGRVFFVTPPGSVWWMVSVFPSIQGGGVE